jgi:hypothetical protein
MTERELPSLFADAAPRRWAVAGKLPATSQSPATPLQEPPVTEGLALFEAASVTEDGYARWKSAVAEEKQSQKAGDLLARSGEDGFERWKSEMDAAKQAFEHRWGIPLGKRVRVQLRGEPREREGLLRLVEQPSSKGLRLSLEGHVFVMAQIESVSRL